MRDKLGDNGVNLPISSSTKVASIRPLDPALQHASRPPATALSIAIGFVLFNNSDNQIRDLARTLHQAIACLEEREAAADPPRTTVVAIHLFNNGERPVDATAFGPHARLTNSAANIGFGRAHNLLMRQAFAAGSDTEFYFAVNPDGMFHPATLVEMIAAARRCGGRALVEAAQFPEELPKIFDPLTLDTPWASGCCLLIPVTIYADIGGFDENMFMFCEDVDLSWRAREAGYAVKYVPRALFHHNANRGGTSYPVRRAHFEAARYLAAKWGGKDLVAEIEREMARQAWEPQPLPTMPPPPVSVADFGHGLAFAPLRWTHPSPIPAHAVTSKPGDDNTIDVIVRFHDPAQTERLSRCLFSLYGQTHQPIQILLMLQDLDHGGRAVVEACVDAFDWSAPRRRPIVTNVSIPRVGDHRARLWNAGLDVGQAHYLGFLDFDDVIYSAGYSYLLHRLQLTGAAATFASSLRTDCTPMHGFDFVFRKEFVEGGDDRYDFFVSGFCPVNTVLIDRRRAKIEDLRADEGLSKMEDYLVFAGIAAKYDTDWASIGTVVSEYFLRTDGSNTNVAHRGDAATRREWQESEERVRRALATMATTVPVKDIVRMRRAERDLRHRVAELEAAAAHERSERAQMKASLSWRLTRAVREVERVIRRLRKPRTG